MVESKDKKLDALFRALAHATRREILALLATRPHNLSEFTSKFGISLTAISRHVHVLDQAGLVHRKFVGRNHMCSLNMEALDALALFAWAKTLSAHTSSASSAGGDRMHCDSPPKHSRAAVKRLKQG